jgi:hypothetical protein
MPYKRRSRFWWTFSIPRPGQFFQKRDFFNTHSRFHSKPFRQESPESAKLVKQLLSKPEGKRCQKRIVGALEDLFERPQISRQTRMPNLMERKSTPAGRKRALNENLDKRAFYAAFWKAMNWVLVAAKRCAFSSR